MIPVIFFAPLRNEAGFVNLLGTEIVKQSLFAILLRVSNREIKGWAKNKRIAKLSKKMIRKTFIRQQFIFLESDQD